MEVNRIILDLPIKSPEYSNVYILENDDGYAVVDGGFVGEKHSEIIKSKLEELDIPLNKTKFLITHHHIDHVGIVLWKKVSSYMHPLEIPFLKLYTDPDYFARPYIEWSGKYSIDMELLKPLYSFFKSSKKMVGYSTGVKIETKSRVQVVEDGEKIGMIRVVHTPGHSPGHLAFYLPDEGVIFSGDVVLSVTTTHVGYYPGYSIDPIGDHMRTLKKLLEMEIDTIYPAHEDIVKNPDRRIQELLNHYRARMEEVHSCIDGEMRVIEVAHRISWSAGSFEDLDPWGKVLAVSETLAFLKRLSADGRVKEREVNGVVHFTV
jgi:glyoxylase-like metal-dependent hydrolase (beta-lactamase superfamily II)